MILRTREWFYDVFDECICGRRGNIGSVFWLARERRFNFTRILSIVDRRIAVVSAVDAVMFWWVSQWLLMIEKVKYFANLEDNISNYDMKSKIANKYSRYIAWFSRSYPHISKNVFKKEISSYNFKNNLHPVKYPT